MKKVSNVDVAGTKLALFEFHLKPQSKDSSKPRVISSFDISFLVDPAKRFIVRGYFSRTAFVNSPTTEIVRGSIEFNDASAEIPIPTQYLREEFTASPTGETIRLVNGEQVVARQTSSKSYTFEQFNLASRPAAVFRLPAFGLPDLTMPTPNAHKGYDARWFFVLAALALVGAVAFKVLAARSRKAALNKTLLGGS